MDWVSNESRDEMEKNWYQSRKTNRNLYIIQRLKEARSLHLTKDSNINGKKFISKKELHLISSHIYYNSWKVTSSSKLNKKGLDWDFRWWNLLLKTQKNYSTSRFTYNRINEIWCVDLIDMSDYKNWNNKGFRYVVVIIDNFSKCTRCMPLKNEYSKENQMKSQRLWIVQNEILLQ